MPQAMVAKQHCIRDRGEGALSFHGGVFLGIVQVTNVTLSICLMCFRNSILLCPSLPRINVALLFRAGLAAYAGCLSGRLDGQEPVLLVFTCGVSSKLHSSKNLSSSSKLSEPRASWCLISLSNLAFCADMRVPVFGS